FIRACRHSSATAALRRMPRRAHASRSIVREQLVGGSQTMKLRNKILLGLAGAVALGIVGVFIAVSIDSPCPSTPVAETGDTTMLARRHRGYGIPRGLQAETRARPEPGEGEVLVRLRASAVNPAEWYQTSGRPRLIRLARGIGAP